MIGGRVGMFTVQELLPECILWPPLMKWFLRRDEVCMGPGKTWLRSGGLVSEGKGVYLAELCRHSNLGLSVGEGS